MGMYDDVLIDRRNGQTKALGRRLRTLRVGDHVSLAQAPMTESDLDAYYDGTWDGARTETTFQCGVYPGGWLVVIDGVLRAWTAEAIEGIPRFSNFGEPLD
jgi:hypothetical protein